MNYRKRTRSTVPAPPESESGYGKPPEHSRFAPGKSGNPAGRPRGSRNLSVLTDKELDRIVTANIDGKPVRLQLRSLIVQKLALDAAKGNASARRTILQLEAQKAMAEEQAAAIATSAEPVSGPADEAILQRYRQELFEEFQRHLTASSDPGTDDKD